MNLWCVSQISKHSTALFYVSLQINTTENNKHCILYETRLYRAKMNDADLDVVMDT